MDDHVTAVESWYHDAHNLSNLSIDGHINPDTMPLSSFDEQPMKLHATTLHCCLALP
jgi:hypothetical protein